MLTWLPDLPGRQVYFIQDRPWAGGWLQGGYATRRDQWRVFALTGSTRKKRYWRTDC